MTINTTSRLAGPFVGTGVIVSYPFTFKVFETSDVLAVVSDAATGVETTWVEGVDYTVVLNANQNVSPGGSLTPVVALAVGKSLSLTSDVDLTQDVEVTNAGGFFPEVFNDVFDRLTIIAQQLLGVVSRSIRVRLGAGISGTALEVSPVANGFLAWNSAGNGVFTMSPSAASALLTITANPATYASAVTDAVSQAATSAAGLYQPKGANLTTLSGYTPNDMTRLGSLIGTNIQGIVVHTLPQSFTRRSLVASTGLVWTNGDGIAGNPSVALDVNALAEDATPDSSNDYLLTWDTSAAAHKKVKPSNFITLTPIPQVIVDYRTTSGTAGAAPAPGWVDVPLNTLMLNTGTLASVASNAVVLPAGTYVIRGHAGIKLSGNAPSSCVVGIRLRNESDGVTIARGPNSYIMNGWSGSDGPGGQVLPVVGVVTLAATKNIKLQIYSPSGLSPPSAISTAGEQEVYAQLEITRVS